MHISSAAFNQQSYQTTDTHPPRVLLNKKMDNNYFYRTTSVSQNKTEKIKPSKTSLKNGFQNEECYCILQVKLQVTSKNTIK